MCSPGVSIVFRSLAGSSWSLGGPGPNFGFHADVAGGINARDPGPAMLSREEAIPRRATPSKPKGARMMMTFITQGGEGQGETRMGVATEGDGVGGRSRA